MVARTQNSARHRAGNPSRSRECSGLVTVQEKHAVVVDDSDSKTIKPAESAEKISAKSQILCGEDKCRELNTNGLD
jgi:hypothetical protein